MNYISIIISVAALAISVLTFWLTRLKKGVVKMTKPTIICILEQNGIDGPKVFIRTLLYSTSDRGQYLQNMFVRLHQQKNVQDFNDWFYGDNGTVKGSGLYIDKSGSSSYHHFLLSKADRKFSFLSGDYLLQVFAETVDKKPQIVFEDTFAITKQQALSLENGKALYYNWSSNDQNYIPYIE